MVSPHCLPFYTSRTPIMKSLVDAFSVCHSYFSLFPWLERKRLILEIATTYQPAFALLRGWPKEFPPHFIQCRENSSSACFMEHTEWKQINMTALSRKNEQSYRYHIVSHMTPVPVWQFSPSQHTSFVWRNHLRETCPVMQQTEIT